MSCRRMLMIAHAAEYAPDETAFLVVTVTENKTYQLQLRDTSMNRLHKIDWGDGTKETVSTGTQNFKAFQHVYTLPGEYEVRIRGQYYAVDLTSYTSTYGSLVKEWFHASLGLTVMQDWAAYASIRAIGPKFALPPNLQSMPGFAREGILPSGAYTKLQLPDTVTPLRVEIHLFVIYFFSREKK